ncbi:EboA domain-containing protein [Azospirillum sp. YIM B02556]|uniref:EboA domain-containing protein n=1 Tax=Azospirillum endophyticum TaxID=2800326 RepID=A0ABS1F8N1_9PROT|nr:EboA domain-containing protein [Azospirillum endophyticum]MBK1839597.1 EboA domain-containing protein [Azospirillum endophyticum]
MAFLPALIAARDPGCAAWLDAALASPPLPGTPAFMRVFAAAGRRLRDAPPPGGDEVPALMALGIATPALWSGPRLLRAALLAAAVEAAGGEAPAGLTSAFRTSDTEERATILQALMLLPDPARFTALAADACRSSVQPVFEAIAGDNGFPAAHLAEPVFNQMVLKAVFTGMPLARIVGLAERTTPALRRMAGDFRSERRAAGRVVPADLDLLLDAPSLDGIPTP